jgi:hypothetical protein
VANCHSAERPRGEVLRWHICRGNPLHLEVVSTPMVQQLSYSLGFMPFTGPQRVDVGRPVRRATEVA